MPQDHAGRHVSPVAWIDEPHPTCATSVYAYATHAVFSGKAAENIKNSVIDEFIVADSVPLSDEIIATGKVKQLTLSGMLAEAIRRVSNEESISAMFHY